MTESAVHKNRLLYFRQDDWITLTQPLLTRLASTMFKPISIVRSLMSLRVMCTNQQNQY